MLGAALLLGALYFAVFGGEYDLFDLRRIRAQQDVEHARVAEERQTVEALRARRDSLASDSATIERFAREQHGLIRPGERLYRFTPAPLPDSSANGIADGASNGVAGGASSGAANGAAAPAGALRDTLPRD